MKPAAPPVLHATRLLDQIRERIRYKHYSLRTEQAYVQWVRMFVKWHGLRHPRDMGREEIVAFLAMLANERRVAASESCRRGHHESAVAMAPQRSFP